MFFYCLYTKGSGFKEILPNSHNALFNNTEARSTTCLKRVAMTGKCCYVVMKRQISYMQKVWSIFDWVYLLSGAIIRQTVILFDNLWNASGGSFVAFRGTRKIYYNVYDSHICKSVKSFSTLWKQFYSVRKG